MYSLILMTAMTTSPAQPQGIFGLRGNCHGTVAAASTGCAGAHIRTRVRAVVETTIRRPVATLLANRPRLFARGGCGGAVAAASTGCSGGAAVAVAQAPPAYQPMPQPPTVGGPISAAAIKLAIRRDLRRALNPKTPQDKAKVQAAFAKMPVAMQASGRETIDKVIVDGERNRHVLALTTEKIYNDLESRQALGAAGPWSDFFSMIIDKLPQILAFIQEIMKLFTMGIIDANTMYAMLEEFMRSIVFTC